MSIATEIQRLQNAKASIKTSIENKGVVVSSSDTLDDYADYIDAINISTQEKTITPQNQTHEITADSGYRGLSKVILDGVLVDAHDSYTTSTDSTTAYTKTVPSGALKYANLDKLGGMSYKWTMVDMGTLNWTYSSSYNDYAFITNFSKPNAKTLAQLPSPFINISINNNGNLVIIFAGGSFANVNELKQALSGVILYYESVDGSTNTILDSAVTSVVSKDSNDTILDTLTVPAEVQALDGYGWGINDTCYNYIDYEAKKFIKNVGKYTFTGNESWNKSGVASNNSYYCNLEYLPFANTTATTSTIADSTEIPNGIHTKYTMTSGSNLINNDVSNVITLANRTLGVQIRFGAGLSNNLTPEQVAQLFANTTLYYELSTPVETDISAYIDDNFVEVEGGGSITANNTYNQAVPSEITYLVEV